jgi:hypothetical protein
MTLRTGHGSGAGVPRIEVMPVDELPAGLPEHTGPYTAADRGAGGRFAPGNRLAAKGGRLKAGALAIVRGLGLADSAASEIAPYLSHAESWRRAKLSELAATVGGGRCGAGVSSIVATAARQLASSLFAFDMGTRDSDVAMLRESSRFGNESRQSLLAAHELAAREATARAAAANAPDLSWLNDPGEPEPEPPKESTP